MADLMDHELHCWNYDLMADIFLPSEAKVILAIPLSLVETPDRLFWPMNRSGVYSIKFGYKLLRACDDSKSRGLLTNLETGKCGSKFGNFMS